MNWNTTLHTTQPSWSSGHERALQNGAGEESMVQVLLPAILTDVLQDIDKFHQMNVGMTL